MIARFRQEFVQIFTDHHISKNNIYNMDQSALYYEVPPRKTTDILGSKQVTLKTKGLTKKRVTIMSLISCSGEVEKQFVIFKGSNEGRVEASLKDYDDSFTCFSCQENAWCDEEKLKKWLSEVWWPVAQRTQDTKLLIVDSYGPHLALEAELRKFNTRVLFVPKGLTWSLQPLDTLFHKSSKQLSQDYFVRNQRSTLKTEEEKRMFMMGCVKEIVARIEKKTVQGSWNSVGLIYPFDDEGEVLRGGPDSMLVEPDLGSEPMGLLMEGQEFMNSPQHSMIEEPQAVYSHSNSMIIESKVLNYYCFSFFGNRFFLLNNI